MHFRHYFGAIVALSICLSQNAAAGVPSRMNYQGVLKDANGQIVPDGSYSVTLRLYDSQGPGGTVLWEESQAVVTTEGLFGVILGSLNPVPESAFASGAFLSIQVGADTEMSPRTQLSSVPYSFKAGDAEKVGGLSVPDLIPPALWNHAFREYVEAPGGGVQTPVFTVPAGKTRYLTGIATSNTIGGDIIEVYVDGTRILTFFDASGGGLNYSWQSGGGAPIVLASGQSVSIYAPGGRVLFTGYEF